MDREEGASEWMYRGSKAKTAHVQWYAARVQKHAHSHTLTSMHAHTKAGTGKHEPT